MLHQSSLHKGRMLQCKTCSPEYQPKKRDREEKKFVRATTLDGVVRRQMAEEIGEDEPSREQRFALLQKYGVVEAKIDRRVKKPSWMGERQWNQKLQEWYRATKGLVPAAQERKPRLKTKPWREIKFKNPKAQARHNSKNRSRHGKSAN